MKFLFLILSLLFTALSFGVELKPYLDGTDQVRFARYMVAVKETEKVVNSPEFKDAVMKMKFTSTTKSPMEILAIMDVGSEGLTPDPNFAWDWGVGFYLKSSSKVIGYTQADWTTVWVNKKFFDKFTIPLISMNVAHEVLHKLGFVHKSASDHKSVPYAIGYLVRDMVQKNLEARPADPVVIPPQNPVNPKPVPRPSWLSRLRSYLFGG